MKRVPKSSFILLQVLILLLYDCLWYWAFFNKELAIATQMSALWKLRTLLQLCSQNGKIELRKLNKEHANTHRNNFQAPINRDKRASYQKHSVESYLLRYES